MSSPASQGRARLVARTGASIRSIRELKDKKVGVTRGGIQEVLLIYLSYPDLNQALMGKDIDAMMQSESRSSQAINRGYGAEVLKPYDTPIGSPVRTIVMTYRPGTVKRDMLVELPRMRDPAAPAFNALERELGQLVMEEEQRHHDAEMRSAAVD